MYEKQICIIDTPLGAMTASAEQGALTGLIFCRDREGTPAGGPEIPIFRALREWLGDYFNGKNPKSDIPLAPRGTPFQAEIWDMLLGIPYGEVLTYGDLAKAYAEWHGGRMSARAVGGAVGRNPITILIPCHRVIGAGGNLTGYGPGLGRKLRLLEIEGVDTSAMALPKSKT